MCQLDLVFCFFWLFFTFFHVCVSRLLSFVSFVCQFAQFRVSSRQFGQFRVQILVQIVSFVGFEVSDGRFRHVSGPRLVEIVFISLDWVSKLGIWWPVWRLNRVVESRFRADEDPESDETAIWDHETDQTDDLMTDLDSKRPIWTRVWTRIKW